MQLTVIVAAVAAVVGALLGSAYTGSVKDAVIARTERDHARAIAAAADANSVRLYDAQHRSDTLTRRLAAERRAAQLREEELTDALAKATDGRVCLREPALRVLDQSPGLQVAGLPAAGGGADGAHAGRVATDTDVAGWSRDAGKRYAECVSRYHALIDFHETPR